MTVRGRCAPAPGLLEDYARAFDDLFSRVAQRGCFRDCLMPSTGAAPCLAFSHLTNYR
jgi:hypothetical protein